MKILLDTNIVLSTEKQEKATLTVLEQAELLGRDWAL